jgi:hypothetical protein
MRFLLLGKKPKVPGVAGGIEELSWGVPIIFLEK